MTEIKQLNLNQQHLLALITFWVDGKKFTKRLSIYEHDNKMSVRRLERELKALARSTERTILFHKLHGYADMSVFDEEKQRVAAGGPRFEDLQLEPFKFSDCKCELCQRKKINN